MSQRKISLAVGEYYHIYNRGNTKQVIYTSNDEYERFKNLLYVANGTKHFEVRGMKNSDMLDFERGEPLVSIGVYCLMPNHFHILLTPIVEMGVQQFMQKLATAYSMYFNKRHLRTGSLYEGKFKARHADSDRYLKYLYAYIHLNPVKLIDSHWKEKIGTDATVLYDFAAKYKYSSLSDYLGGVRRENLIIDKNNFPDYFTTHEAVKKELFDWLTLAPDTL